MKRVLVFILVVTMIVCVAAGCQQQAATSSEPPATTPATVESSPASAAPSTEPASASPTETEAESYKIAYTSRFLGNSWRAQYEEAIRNRFEAYQDMGVVSDYTYVACNNDVTEQQNQLNVLLQEDYDVIMVDPVSIASLTSFIDEAESKGVKLLFGLASTAYEGIPCFSNDYGIYAKAEAYYLCEKLGGEGNVVEIFGVAGDPNAELYARAAHEAYAEYPGINVLASGTGNWNDADAQTEMATLLSAHGDQIDAVFCEDGMAYGIANAFQNANKAVVPMGGDYFNTFIQYWYENQDSLDTIVTVSSPNGMGSLLVDCCVYMAAGHEAVQITNPLDPSIENWCALSFPNFILEEAEMNASWLSEFPNTAAMSLNDAYTLMEGKELTAAPEVYFDDDYIASLFGLDESLWW